jgi:GNAT superfamily N-acetyltransferase
MNKIEIIPVSDKRTLRKFIMLPRLLHRNHANWVPPIYQDEWQYFNRKKNPAFEYCEINQALAYYDGYPAGRIMGVINHRYNDAKNAHNARFCLFESINNQKIADSLFRYIEEWALRAGMTEIIGPFGMYYHDPIGFIVQGYEYIPALTTYYNFDYIVTLVENEGYTCDKELEVYKIMLPDGIPEIYKKILSKVSNNSNIKLVPLHHRNEMKPYILPVLRLMNETYADIYGYSQLDEKEMTLLAKQYISLLDPGLVKIAEYSGEVAGFFIAMPNISKGIIASKGYLFPFGIFKILSSAKKSKQLDLLLGAIKKKYQGIGIDVLMGMDMIETAKKKGFEFIDSHLEMETNLKVRAEMERVGGKEYKKYRIYKKVL